MKRFLMLVPKMKSMQENNSDMDLTKIRRVNLNRCNNKRSYLCKSFHPLKNRTKMTCSMICLKRKQKRKSKKRRKSNLTLYLRNQVQSRSRKWSLPSVIMLSHRQFKKVQSMKMKHRKLQHNLCSHHRCHMKKE